MGRLACVRIGSAAAASSEAGKEALAEYTQLKNVYVDLS